MQNEDTSWIKPVNMLAFGGKWLPAKARGRTLMILSIQLGITDYSKAKQMELTG
jgi:hypothetical protein